LEIGFTTLTAEHWRGGERGPAPPIQYSAILSPSSWLAYEIGLSSRNEVASGALDVPGEVGFAGFVGPGTPPFEAHSNGPWKIGWGTAGA
jgi:hypothetical protein